MILFGIPGIDALKALKKEFGPKFKHFMLGLEAEPLNQAEEMINLTSSTPGRPIRF